MWFFYFFCALLCRLLENRQAKNEKLIKIVFIQFVSFFSSVCITEWRRELILSFFSLFLDPKWKKYWFGLFEFFLHIHLRAVVTSKHLGSVHTVLSCIRIKGYILIFFWQFPMNCLRMDAPWLKGILLINKTGDANGIDLKLSASFTII